jgi:hypothetical protein
VVGGAGAPRVADAAITGVHGAVRRMRTHAHSGIVLAMFRATGAARMFAAPLHELFGQTLALDTLVPRADVARVIDQVAAQPITGRGSPCSTTSCSRG